MIKTIFFDTKDYEIDYFNKTLGNICDNRFINSAIQTYSLTEDITEDVEILSVFTTSRLDKNIIKKFPKLKLIATRSTGFSHIDIEFCKSINIPVVNVKHYGDCTIAEFAFGLLLNVSRKIQKANSDLKNGIIKTEHYIGNDFFEKTIGIIGTGSIGSHAVRIANGFGMNIIAYDIYPNQELVDQYRVKYVSLDELCKNSDYITIHAPATKENCHMINAKSFEIMKTSVIIANTARGEIIDTEALYFALKNGKVKAAGLDVLECEELFENDKIDCINPDCLKRTLINHKILDLPNVIVTPHIAFDSHEAVKRIMEKTAQNIEKFVLQNETFNRVNQTAIQL
ncbi:MAG: NAD(P)-dependent oxidoreductase [Candidatus Gastranaerophilaceae bacterium]|jgi:D-lactate dehydrogenase